MPLVCLVNAGGCHRAGAGHSLAAPEGASGRRAPGRSGRPAGATGRAGAVALVCEALPRVLDITRDGFPEGAVLVDRTTRLGNPFRVGRDGSRAQCIAKHRVWIKKQPHLLAYLRTLRGRDMVCHCTPLPCHGTTCLEIANALPSGRYYCGSSSFALARLTNSAHTSLDLSARRMVSA